VPLKRSIVAALIGVLLFSAAAAAGEGNRSRTSSADGYMFRARAKGIFGMKRGEEGDAFFYLTPTKLRIDLDSGESSSILDLDCKHLIEMSHVNREYKLRLFDKLPFRWKSRRKDLEYMKKRFEDGVRGGVLTRKAAAEQARKCGLHVNDDYSIEVKQVVEVINTGNSSTIAGYSTKEVVVKENGIEVFRLWLTDELSRPFNVMKFYTAVGYISPEMVKELGRLKGFPVKLHMKITVKQKVMKVDMTLSEYLPAKIYPALFTVPGSYRKKKPKGLPKWVCRYCSGELPEKHFKLFEIETVYELCSKECVSKLELEFNAADEGGYFSLLRQLLDKRGSFKMIEKELDARLKVGRPPVDRERIKKAIQEDEE